MKEPFTNSNPGTSPLIYSNTEKEKTLAILKDHYEIDALLNIAQVAKGLQTTGKHIFPGSLEVKGTLEVGNNIRITSNTIDGDVITVGNGTAATGTNGKVRINIGKYSLVPNLSGTDDYLEFRHNSNGATNNDKVMGKISKDASDKFLIYSNANNTNNFFVKDRLIGFNGDLGSLSVNTLNGNNIKTNNIVNTEGNPMLRFEDNKSKLCNGSTDCSRFLYVNKNDMQGGYASTKAENTNFTISSAGNNPERKFEIINENNDTRIWKNGKLRMAIEPGATKIAAGDNFNAKHFFIENNDGNFNFGAWNTQNNATYLALRNNTTENNIEARDKHIFINNDGNKIIEMNRNGNLKDDPNKIFVINGNNGNNVWVSKDGAIGSWGKFATKGNCNNNICNTRVKYCEHGSNDLNACNN
jgi:hypothetical protein